MVWTEAFNARLAAKVCLPSQSIVTCLSPYVRVVAYWPEMVQIPRGMTRETNCRARSMLCLIVFSVPPPDLGARLFSILTDGRVQTQWEVSSVLVISLVSYQASPPTRHTELAISGLMI